jgi:sugar diacid utilization regulator
MKNDVDQIDEISTKLALNYTDKASDARGHRKLSTAKLDKRYSSMALAHEKIRQRHAKVPTTEEKTMKTLSQFMEESALLEAHDVELKPHANGTHYIVHKIHPKSGIESDQLKKGEKISDSHVDDLHDMGYSVKIHKK